MRREIWLGGVTVEGNTSFNASWRAAQGGWPPASDSRADGDREKQEVECSEREEEWNKTAKVHVHTHGAQSEETCNLSHPSQASELRSDITWPLTRVNMLKCDPASDGAVGKSLKFQCSVATSGDNFSWCSNTWAALRLPCGFCKVFLPCYRINDLLAII